MRVTEIPISSTKEPNESVDNTVLSVQAQRTERQQSICLVLPKRTPQDLVLGNGPLEPLGHLLERFDAVL